jgi:hypothetical protein
MRKILLITLLLASPAGTCLAGQSCGEDGMICGEDEVCCENVVASFSESTPAGPAYVEGKCIPRGQKCNDFVCGNRRCQGGFFRMPTVCCIQQLPDAVPTYTCATSELSCPGNGDKLTIRGGQSLRSLQRG